MSYTPEGIRIRNDEVRKRLLRHPSADGFLTMTTGFRIPRAREGWWYLFRYNGRRYRGKGGNVHKFRHTFGSILVQQLVDIYRVKELMGHRDINTTMRYANLRKSDLHDAIQCLTNLQGAKKD